MISCVCHDGDGRQVKSVINGVTTLYVGAHYQIENGVVVKYYFAGSQRIAMRRNGTLSYLLSDHLGSTVATTNTSGQLASGQLYKAWGKVRYALGTSPTKYTYTGQYSNVSDFGLMFYNARWYDPVSGRFASADSIVPAGVQGLDRYAYANNSPVKYIDPSGYRSCTTQQANTGDETCWQNVANNFSTYSDLEQKILKTLHNKGGSTAQHGVLYILENNVHIAVGSGWQAVGGATAAWFDETSNTLTLNSDMSAGSVDANGDPTVWGLSLVIHEARHLEQGSNFSHSKLGEMDAWQIQIDVLANLGYFPLSSDGQPILPTWAQNIANAQTVEDFSLAIQSYYPNYWNRLKGSGSCVGLCSYPDLPDVCMMAFGTCPPELPWWLRLDFPP